MDSAFDTVFTYMDSGFDGFFFIMVGSVGAVLAFGFYCFFCFLLRKLKPLCKAEELPGPGKYSTPELEDLLDTNPSPSTFLENDILTIPPPPSYEDVHRYFGGHPPTRCSYNNLYNFQQKPLGSKGIAEPHLRRVPCVLPPPPVSLPTCPGDDVAYDSRLGCWVPAPPLRCNEEMYNLVEKPLGSRTIAEPQSVPCYPRIDMARQGFWPGQDIYNGFNPMGTLHMDETYSPNALPSCRDGSSAFTQPAQREAVNESLGGGATECDSVHVNGINQSIYELGNQGSVIDPVTDPVSFAEILKCKILKCLQQESLRSLQNRMGKP